MGLSLTSAIIGLGMAILGGMLAAAGLALVVVPYGTIYLFLD